MMLAYCSAYYSTYQAFFSKELRYSSHDFLLVTFIHATITRPHKLGRVAQRKKKSKKFYCLIMYVLGACMKGTQNCQKWNNIWSHIGGQLHPKNIYMISYPLVVSQQVLPESQVLGIPGRVEFVGLFSLWTTLCSLGEPFLQQDELF